MEFLKAKNGQKVRYQELERFINVTTSNLESIAKNWGLDAKSLHSICSEKNPEMAIYKDDTTPFLNTKDHQAYFADTNFLYQNTNN